MALSPGDRAEDADVWMRILTNAKYLKKDGTIHNKAFGGKKAIAPPAGNAPWSLEISGRLLSLVNDIEAESQKFCQLEPLEFVGLMFQKVEALRTDGQGGRKPLGAGADVIYTPNNDDMAHADLVFYGQKPDDRDVIRDWLQDFIQTVEPTKCKAVLDALR